VAGTFLARFHDAAEFIFFKKVLRMVIFHIAQRDQWEAARAGGVYRAGSLATQGFIHCSTREQVLATANRVFRGQTGLVLLGIEAGKVETEIRYENLEGGSELYPHIYGPLNVDAVVSTAAFKPQADGEFRWPEGF
jgi:uncharacterized protein (DUF952 family)